MCFLDFFNRKKIPPMEPFYDRLDFKNSKLFVGCSPRKNPIRKEGRTGCTKTSSSVSTYCVRNLFEMCHKSLLKQNINS